MPQPQCPPQAAAELPATRFSASPAPAPSDQGAALPDDGAEKGPQRLNPVLSNPREAWRFTLSNLHGSVLRPVPSITSQNHLAALVSVTFSPHLQSLQGPVLLWLIARARTRSRTGLLGVSAGEHWEREWESQWEGKEGKMWESQWEGKDRQGRAGEIGLALYCSLPAPGASEQSFFSQLLTYPLGC